MTRIHYIFGVCVLTLSSFFLPSALMKKPLCAEENFSTLSPNCGVKSVVNLSHLLGREVGQQKFDALCKTFPQPTVSMLEVKKAGEMLGIKLQGTAVSLDELQQHPRLAIVALTDHFVILDRVTPKWVRIFELAEMPQLESRADFERNYTGTALLLEQPTALSKSKSLTVDEYIKDLGQLPQNTHIKITASLTNTGQEPITIKQIDSSCGCTVPERIQNTIAPGQIVSLEMTIAVPLSGQVSSSVAITSDAVPPVQFISIFGNVEKGVKVEPHKIDLGEITKGQVAQKTMIVHDPDHKLSLPLKLTTTSPSLETTWTQEDKETYKIVLTLNESRPVGTLDESVLIQDAQKGGTVLSVPVIGSVLSLLRATPPKVFFGAVSAAKGNTREIQLARVDHKAFEIDKIICPNNIQAKVLPLGLNKELWSLTLLVPPNQRSTTLQGSVLITTKGADAVTLQVPVYGIIQ